MEKRERHVAGQTRLGTRELQAQCQSWEQIQYSWIHLICPLAEFTFLTEPFPMEDKDSRYSVNFPGAPMVAYCAKGIAGKKDAGALLLGHLMSHEPCHTLHPIHPAHPPAPPFLHPSFLCIHISRYVYTHMCWVYTREGFVYTPNFICVYTKSRVCVYTKTSFVYTPKHHLCIHQI